MTIGINVHEARVLPITTTLSIPERELQWRASRSRGPGGQHVNKVNTRVTLSFDVAGSPSLTAPHKRRMCDTLRTRITKEGILSVSTQRSSSQAANLADARETLCRLLRDALTPRKARHTLRIPRRAIERRLHQKRQRGEVKHLRVRPPRSED